MIGALFIDIFWVYLSKRYEIMEITNKYLFTPTDSQIELFKQMGSVINYGNSELWHFLPYYFKQVEGEDKWEMVFLEDLPNYIKDIIERNRIGREKDVESNRKFPLTTNEML